MTRNVGRKTLKRESAHQLAEAPEQRAAKPPKRGAPRAGGAELQEKFWKERRNAGRRQDSPGEKKTQRQVSVRCGPEFPGKTGTRV